MRWGGGGGVWVRVRVRQKELHSPSSACFLCTYPFPVYTSKNLNLRRASSYELSYCAGSVTRMNDGLFKWEI